ncbi:MAG: hypothetical protein EOO90_01925 [Pedobacter sp.]|nr:MAG: hypothetical protein EOO90_01925 [Pedobacter sp.]
MNVVSRLVQWQLGNRTSLLANMNVGLANGYQIGAWTVPWTVVAGSNASYFKPENVELYIEEGHLEITDPELARRISEVTTQQDKLKLLGKSSFHDGPTLGLLDIGETQKGDEEEPVLRIHLKRSNYFMFLAIVNRLDEKFTDTNGSLTTIRQKYISGNYKEPVPQLAPVFAIQMSLITNDGYFLVTKRASKGVAGYANHLAPAVNECLHPIKDKLLGEISILATVIRSAKEELNIEISESEIKFFTMGVDQAEYMYTLTGVIECKEFDKQMLSARLKQGAKEGFESDGYFFLGPDLGTCAKEMSQLSEQFKWAPYGVVCLTQAMVYKFASLRRVEEALTINPPKSNC